MIPCACGRPLVPELDMYIAHLQTPEHMKWRIETRELGRKMTRRELFDELFGLDVSENCEPVDEREWLPTAFSRAAA